MSWEELDQMRDVFEYANHTGSLHTRNNGKGALEDIDKNSFAQDIKACEDYVTTKHVFAYPFGIYTTENMDWLREGGFLMAFTSVPGKNTKETNPYELYRDGVLLDYDLEKFKAVLSAEI